MIIHGSTPNYVSPCNVHLVILPEFQFCFPLHSYMLRTRISNGGPSMSLP